MMLTPRIKIVKALTDNLIYLKFVDGKEKVYDMTNFILSFLLVKR